MLPTLFEKLQLKDEKNLLIQGLPSTIEKQFAKLSFAKNVTPLLKIRKIDFALIFALNQSQLNSILTEVLPALQTKAKLWIAFPKLPSKIVAILTAIAPGIIFEKMVLKVKARLCWIMFGVHYNLKNYLSPIRERA